MILVDCECVHTVTVWFALKSSSPHILLLVQWQETVLLQLKFLHKLPSELTLPKKVPYCKKKNSCWWVKGWVLIHLKGIWLREANNSLKTSSSKVQITQTCQSFVSSHEEYRSTFLSQVHILIKTEMENEKKKPGIDTCELPQQPLSLCNTLLHCSFM